jgi:hypothetical protein
MDQSLEKVERRQQGLSRSGAAMGAALGTLGGIFADSARAAAEAEVSQERLRTSIEATGDSFEEYADQVAAAGEAAMQMGFDDEAAADAISFLTQATGDAATAIGDLGLVMDIARGRGIAMADAARIVAAAEQERFTALRRIGIVLDENATKEEALAALQSKYAGQAEAYADTQAGALDRWRVKLDEVQEAIGEHAGGMQSLLMVLPGVSAAFTGIAAAAGAAATAMGLSATSASAAAKAWGPLGLLGALTALAVAFDQQRDKSNMEDIWENWDEGAENLTKTLNGLAASGSADLLALGDASNQVITSVKSDLDELARLGEIVESGDATEAQRNQLFELSAAYQTLGADVSTYSDVQSSLALILSNTGVGADLARTQLEALNGQFERGEKSAAVWATGVVQLAESLPAYDRAATNAAVSTEEVGDAIDYVGTIYEANKAALAGELFTTMAENAAKAEAAIRDTAIAQFTSDWSALTGELTNTGAALENTFRVIVGNTNAIAQQSQQVADWATELIAVEGTYSALDDLLNAGRINLLQYNVAQEAHNDIIRENAEIQEHVQVIQAKQAPVLAELMAAQENYIQGLSERTGQEQVAALAMMDSATNAKALEIALLAAQGASAEALTPLIEGAIAANPPLEAVLDTMGLISRDHEGNLIVNTSGKDDVDSLIDALDRATQATWVATFDGDISAAEAAYNAATGMNVSWDNLIGTSSVEADNAPATASISWAQQVLATWDGSSGTANMQVSDNATPALYQAISLLNAMDGRSVTAYIHTVSTFSGSSLSPLGYAHGGVVDGYAAGGVVAQMAEYGPEMLHFPNGGVALARSPGIYNIPQNTYVDTADSTASKLGGFSRGVVVNLTINGNVGIDDIAEQVTRQLVPAIQRASSAYLRGYGM